MPSDMTSTSAVCWKAANPKRGALHGGAALPARHRQPGGRQLDAYPASSSITSLQGSWSPALKKLLKRKQAIESTIGHVKTDRLLARNWLKGQRRRCVGTD